MRRWSALLAAVLGAVLAVAIGLTGTASAAPTVSEIATALATNPIYVDPASTVQVDAAQVKAVIPANTYLVVLATSGIPAGAQPDEVPALLSAQVGKGGTFVVLIGTQLFGSSTTIPGRLGGELASAQSVLTGDATAATGPLVALLRSLSGSGDLKDAQGPARAGGPVGAALLIAFAIAAAVAGLSLWWWLRRKPGSRRRRAKPVAQPRDLVEIDYEGTIIKRTPASER